MGTDLLSRARGEIETFQRTSRQTSLELIAALDAALRAAVPSESILRPALQLCVDMILANGLETALSNTLETAREALAASPAVPEVEPVAVKPLGWICAGQHLFKAVSPFGSYCIEDQGENWTDDRYWLDFDGRKIGKFGSSEPAKAAAQADYEQRIRSALVPAPRSDMERELAEARAKNRELNRRVTHAEAGKQQRRDIHQLWCREFSGKLRTLEAERDALASDKARLEGERRMIVSHATMGQTDGEGLSVNDVSVRITALRNQLYEDVRARAALSGASIPSDRLRVLDQSEWTPCSPEWLEAHPAQCCAAPRVWSEERKNHYHPVNWPIPTPADKAEERRAELEEAAATGYRICAETRHVTLGNKVAAAIRALISNPAREG
jgi:hypothetical protein